YRTFIHATERKDKEANPQLPQFQSRLATGRGTGTPPIRRTGTTFSQFEVAIFITCFYIGSNHPWLHENAWLPKNIRLSVRHLRSVGNRVCNARAPVHSSSARPGCIRNIFWRQPFGSADFRGRRAHGDFWP